MCPKAVRTLDISGLVSLRKYFARGARIAPWTAAIAVTAMFAPELDGPIWAGLLAAWLLVSWFVLSRGLVGAALFVMPGLLATILALIGIRWSQLSSPATDPELAVLTYLAIFLYVPVQGLLGLVTPDSRAAARSPHLRALFTRSPNAESTRTHLMRRVRSVRLLPVAVIVAMGLGVFGYVAMTDSQTEEQRRASKRTAQTVLAAAGGAALLWARRRSARRGIDARRADTRPPILLLRSFGDDLMRLERGAKWTPANDILRHGMTFERVVVAQLDRFGPVIAIGKPGEALAPLGASRDYVGDDVWQDEVEQRMREATLIVLMLGTSEGLAWELLRAHRLQLLHKLVLVFPPAKNLHERWRTLFTRDAAAGAFVLPDALDPTRVLALVWKEDGQPMALEGPRTEWAYETAIRLVMPTGR